MKYHSAGDSHGPATLVIVDDVPAGLALDTSAIDLALAERLAGYGRSPRAHAEGDRARILSGLWRGSTSHSPLAIAIDNSVADGGTDAADVPVTVPRPGHADYPGMLKYDLPDTRAVSERASARETAARVAAGAVAQQVLRELGVCVSAAAHEPDVAAIDAARADGDTLGGMVTVTATGVVPGLGSYVRADTRLDARIAAALISIPSVKGIQFGAGFDFATMRGSDSVDALRVDTAGHISYATNRAGGITGGMSTGQAIVATLAVKPVPTTDTAQDSVDVGTRLAAHAPSPRHDTCVVHAVATIAVAELALVLVTAYQEQFGGDVLADMVQALARYRARIDAAVGCSTETEGGIA
jgi:chorismate synthase